MADATFRIELDIPFFVHPEDILDEQTRVEINTVLAEMCDPYVPYRTGALAGNIVIDSTGITYEQPYAEKNYFGVDIPHNPTHHPLATAKWDEAMMADHGEEFLARVSEIVMRRFREVNGRG